MKFKQSKRKFLIFFTGGVLIVFLLISNERKAKDHNNYSSKLQGVPVERVLRDSKVVSVLKTEEKKVVNKKQEKIKEKLKVSFAKEYSQKSSLFFLKSMSVVCDEACEVEWRKFLQNPKTVNYSRKILSDLAFAQKEHGEEQAYARLMALESLKRAAEVNGPDLLEEAILENFSQIKNNRSFNGYRNDLSDLIDLWIQSYGKNNILSNPSILFTKFNYRPEYKDIFVAAIGYSFPKLVSSPHKSKIFTEVLKNYE